MNDRIVLCPGQGAQIVGMGRAWADASAEARAVFDEADRVLGDRLGAPLSRLCFVGPEQTLNRTDVSQPAIYVASVASWHGLLARWGATDSEAGVRAVAGLSLGEYTALHLAGAVDFADGLELVALRGRAMQDAAEAAPGGMVAIIGASEEQAGRVCDEAREDGVLVCANFNAPGQVVVSGDADACQRAVDAAVAAGFRATRLPVAGAFHSPLMAPAAERLESALAGTRLSRPRCAVMSNVTGRPHEAADGDTIEQSIRRRLVEQLTHPVRWAECFAGLAGFAGGSGGQVEFDELAPGRTLMGLGRRIDRAIEVTTHDTP